MHLHQYLRGLRPHPCCLQFPYSTGAGGVPRSSRAPTGSPRF